MKHNLARLILLAALPALAHPTLANPPGPSRPAKQAGRSPVKVFILAGQSNMEGQAVVDLAGKDYNEGRGTLAALMLDPLKNAMFKHLKDADGKWTVRDDVWVRYQREGRRCLPARFPSASRFTAIGITSGRNCSSAT